MVAAGHLQGRQRTAWVKYVGSPVGRGAAEHGWTDTDSFLARRSALCCAVLCCAELLSPTDAWVLAWA